MTRGLHVLNGFLRLTSRNARSKRFYSDAAQSTKAYVPVHEEMQQQLLYKKPDQPPNPRRLRVGVVGMPNVGKSTLINTLCGTPVMATAYKTDTTVTNAMAVLTKGETQIEFYDTPGIRSRRKAKRISGSYARARLPQKSMQEADLCMVVVDLLTATIRRGTLCGLTMLHLMQNQHVPTILVLNKVDKVRMRMEILPLITTLTNGVLDGKPFGPNDEKLPPPIEIPPMKTEVIETFMNIDRTTDQHEIDEGIKNETRILKELNSCTGWPHFKEVFVISALKGDQTDELRDYLCRRALPQQWRYHSQLVTDKSPHEIAMDAVRSTLMENLDEEVPYTTIAKVAEWQYRNDVLHIFLELECEKAKHIGYVEKKGTTIAFGIKKRLSAVFGVKVEIGLSVDCS